MVCMRVEIRNNAACIVPRWHILLRHLFQVQRKFDVLSLITCHNRKSKKDGRIMRTHNTPAGFYCACADADALALELPETMSKHFR